MQKEPQLRRRTTKGKAPKTRRRTPTKLRKTIPEYLPPDPKILTPTEKKINCRGPNVEDCLSCPNIKECAKKREGIFNLFASIPQYIIDLHMRNVTRTAWVLFTALCRFASFKKEGMYTGRTRVSHDRLCWVTKISKNNLDKYLKELVDEKLIQVNTIRKGGKEISTYNTYWVIHMQKLQKIKDSIKKS